MKKQPFRLHPLLHFGGPFTAAFLLPVTFIFYCALSSAPARAISSTVVISEFRTRGPNGANDEFIELYNLSSSPVNIEGWKVKGSNSLGTVSTRATISSGTVLNPGCHYLLTNLNTDGYSGSVPGNQNFSPGITDDGGIALTRPDDTVVDQVGISSGSAFKEGSTLAPLTTNTNRSYERKPGGASGSGTDTDNNGNDFQSISPSDPQNLSGTCLSNSTPTNPSGVGAAAPSTVSAGSTTLLTVIVTPGANPTSTGLTVTGNLTSISGSANQGFFNNGTNGDVTAGDNIFSFQATVASGTAPGSKSLQVTIADAQSRTGSTTIALTVQSGPGGATAIHDIQGRAHVSHLLNSTVSNVRGIVTAKRSNGFYMQDPVPDADLATSEAIFVFTSSTPTVNVGDAVAVGGTVTEFRPGGSSSDNLSITEIISPSISVSSSGNALPSATVIGTGGRIPPSTVIEDDATGDVETTGIFDPLTDGIDFYESLEAMLVQVNNAVVIGPRLGSGEISVLGDNGVNAGVRTTRGGIVVRAADFNPERIFIDNAIQPTPQVNVGDHFVGVVVGVLDYSSGNFKLQATQPLTASPSGLTQEVTSPAGTGQIAVATFNVENLDPGDSATKFNTLADLVVNNLKSPDIIALEEVQDNNGDTDDSVVDATITYNMLISAIRSAGGPTYQVRNINPVAGQDGGEPGGNIRVGFLFRTDRGLAFVDRPGGDAITATTIVNSGSGPQLSFSPGRIDPANDAFDNSRKPLAGEFSFNGSKLFVIANHFTSKLGDEALFGRFQPPMLSSAAKRIEQAQAVNNFVDAILVADPNANIVVLGDFNDFEFSVALGTLKGGALNNLIESLPQSERYTFVFDGNSQALDHILMSNSLFNRPFEYDVVHVNSEFVQQSSDHDPQVVRLSVGGPDFALEFDPATVSAQRGTNINVTVKINRTGGFNGNVTVTAPDTAALKIKVKPPSKPTTGDSVKFKLKIKSGAPTGTQQLTFVGKDESGRERTTLLTLVIQ
jgi:predicted extracellular nuclease